MASLHPFADDLKVTVPQGEYPFVRDSLEEPLRQAGGSPEGPDFIRLGEGVVTFHTRGRVGCVRISGRALAELRGAGLFLPVLGVLGDCPHRVTGLHVALDVPEPAAAVVEALYRKGCRGEVLLTRKSVPRSGVSRFINPAADGGPDTGTVYLGGKKAEVRACIYDKRDELLCRAIRQHGNHPDVIAANDPGPLTRYELRFGRHTGLTLRDVAEPAPLFWKHASGLLRAPEGVPDWQPHGEGFVMPKFERDPMRQLLLVLEGPEVKRMARLSAEVQGLPYAEVLQVIRSLAIHGRRVALQESTPTLAPSC